TSRGSPPCAEDLARLMGALLVEFGLHRVKKLTIEDGGLLAGKYFAFEHNLADEEPIAEKMGKRTSGERDSANRAPGLEQSHLGDNPPFAQVGHQAVEAPNVKFYIRGHDCAGLCRNQHLHWGPGEFWQGR